MKSWHKNRAQKALKVLECVEKFIDKHEITCAESIYQCDDVSLNSFALMEELCDIAGYDYIEKEE